VKLFFDAEKAAVLTSQTLTQTNGFTVCRLRQRQKDKATILRKLPRRLTVIKTTLSIPYIVETKENFKLTLNCSFLGIPERITGVFKNFTMSYWVDMLSSVQNECLSNE